MSSYIPHGMWTTFLCFVCLKLSLHNWFDNIYAEHMDLYLRELKVSIVMLLLNHNRKSLFVNIECRIMTTIKFTSVVLIDKF